MRSSTVVRALVVLFLASSTWALDGRKPGSVLIFPVQRTGPGFTVLSVTNGTNKPAGPTDPNGATNIHWEFVNVVPGATSLLPDTCTVNNRREYLTPADTRAVLAACLNPGSNYGYAVVSAQDPSTFDENWVHEHLMGSEVVVNPSGSFYILNALPFSSPQPAGSHTDNSDPFAGVGPGQGDGDGQIDFDGLEYEGMPDHLYGDHFLALPGSTLTLLNFSGGTPFVASVDVDVWNDNEFALSTSFAFRCWMDERLGDLSPVFTANYLTLNTPDDPKEVDVDCDEVGDLESGWFRLRGSDYSSNFETCTDPALLGALSFGPSINGKIDGAHLMWESRARQFNGDFFKSGSNDPECSIFTQTAGDPEGDPVAVNGSSEVASEHAASASARAAQEATNRPPACDAGPSKSGEVGVPATFDGTGSFDSDGTIVRYDWNFGDGSPTEIDAGPTPTHTYAARGTFVVTLRVMDDRGSTSTCTSRVTIRRLPFCEFGGVFVGSVLNPIEFVAEAAGGENTLQFDWDFGDGATATTLEPVATHSYDFVGTYPVFLTVTDSRGRQTTCSTTATATAVSGAIAFTNDDADDHCLANLCGGYVPALLQWCLDHSRNQGTGILAVGLQPTVLPVFFSQAEFAFSTWLPFLDDPATPVTLVTTPAELMAVDFDDFAMVYVPSFEGHTAGGISQDMIDALVARKGSLAEYVLERGGSLLALTQSEDDDFVPQVMNGYDWSPIPFGDVPMRFFEVEPTVFALNGAPGIGAPLPGTTGMAISHEAFHGYFVPDPVLGFSGLEVLLEGDEPGVQGEPAAIGGVPEPGVPSQLVDTLVVCDVTGPTTASLFEQVTFDASSSFSIAGTIASYGWNFGDGSPFALNAGPQPSHVYTSTGEFDVTVVLTDDTGATSFCSMTITVEGVSGGLVFSADDAEEHCQAFLCDQYVASLFDWCLDRSHTQGEGILVVGVQPSDIPTFFSVAQQALTSWRQLLDDPLTPVTIVDTPAELMAESFDAYEMVFVPSFEGHVPGGITEAMLDALAARKSDLEDYTLRRGGSLLVHTQHPDPDFTRPFSNGYGFSPIPLTPVDRDLFNVQPTPAALNGTPAYPAPLPGTSGPGISHEAFHGWFEPDPVNGFYGLDVFLVGNEPGAFGEAIVIGGVPNPPGSSVVIPPVCDAGGPYFVNDGDSVQFDASGSLDPSGVIVSYDWDFGDGTILVDAGPMPAHVYASNGIYTVVLTLVSQGGLMSICTTNVVVNALPFCDAGNDLQANVGDDVFFDGTASVDPDGIIVKYTWNFGNGIIGENFGPLPTFFYTVPGVYTVLLTVTDDLGGQSTCSMQVEINGLPVCVPPPPLQGQVGDAITFDASGSFDPDGAIVRYDWDFGDGSPVVIDAGPIPIHVYTVPGIYTVTLTITDDDGAMSTCTTTAGVNAPPVCDAGPNVAGNVGQFLMFDASGSFDTDGAIVSYDWDFGDGQLIQVDAGPTPSHSYFGPGDFTVTVVVTDDEGATSSCTTQAFVNAFPLCDAGPAVQGLVGNAINFDGTNSFDPDGAIVRFDWEFGDGSPPAIDAGPTPSHAYGIAGTYTVVLTVTDDDGASSSCSGVAEIEGVSGALAFTSDDAENHCGGAFCGAYLSTLLQWGLDNSHSEGEGILAVGVQPTVLPVFLSVANQSLNGWISRLDDPSTPLQLVSDPAAFMAEDFDDYALIFIPSFEQVVGGGISQEMIDALVARRADLADWCLRRGGSLVALTQVPQPNFDPPIANAYDWSPVPFSVQYLLFEEAKPTEFGLNGVPGAGVPAPLPGMTAAELSHEAWRGVFVPSSAGGFQGLGVIAVGNEPVSEGLPVVIGGIPSPPAPDGEGDRRGAGSTVSSGPVGASSAAGSR